MKFSKVWLVIGVFIAISLMISGLMVFGESTGDAGVYFPLKTGNTWIYKLSVVGGPKINQHQKIKVTDPEKGNPKVIIYDDNTPQIFITYLENNKGLFKIKEMTSSGILEFSPVWQVLGADMSVGSTWKWESNDREMKESAKVTAAEKVTVPAGTFDTVLVQCEGMSGKKSYTTKTWYAKGIGYVKDEITTNGKTLVSELTEYKLEN